MANEKLQINIPLSAMKNATQRRTRSFLCCSCLGPKESMSDSAITVTLGKYDDCEYVVEKLAIKRIPTRLLTHEEITSEKVEKNPSNTTTQSIQLEDLEDLNKKRPTGITFSSYYKMVPNKASPDKIPQMRERTDSSIITLSDIKNQTDNECDLDMTYEGTSSNKQTSLDRNYESEWEFKSYNTNVKPPIREMQKFHPTLVDKIEGIDYDINDDKYPEVTDEKSTETIDPQTKKTLQLLGGAPAGENIHRYYHNFSKGPVRCIEHPGIANKYIGIAEYPEPISMNVRNKYDNDSDDISTCSTLNSRQKLRWKLLIKHHDSNIHKNKPSPIESTTEICSDSEY